VARHSEEDFPIALQLIARDVFLGLEVGDSCRITKKILLMKNYITRMITRQSYFHPPLYN